MTIAKHDDFIAVPYLRQGQLISLIRWTKEDGEWTYATLLVEYGHRKPVRLVGQGGAAGTSGGDQGGGKARGEQADQGRAHGDFPWGDQAGVAAR